MIVIFIETHHVYVDDNGDAWDATLNQTNVFQSDPDHFLAHANWLEDLWE